LEGSQYKKISPLLLVQSLRLTKYIDPKQNIKNIYELGTRFNNFISTQDHCELGSELRKLENNYTEMRKSIKSKNIDNYLEAWRIEKRKYPLIYRLALAMQTLPYSSASIERLFSEIGKIVTVKRNRLSIQNIEACIFVRQEYKGKTNYFTKEMCNKYYKISAKDFSQDIESDILSSQKEIQTRDPQTESIKITKSERFGSQTDGGF